MSRKLLILLALISLVLLVQATPGFTDYTLLGGDSTTYTWTESH